MRYFNAKEKVLYYFQDLTNIVNYSNIVICEGVFDLINMHNYCNIFNNDTFYIAMNGSSYVETAKYIISNYLLIGDYRLHIVVDKGLIGMHSMIRKLQYQASRWNNRVIVNFYEPILSKDTSELMMLDRMDV